MTMSTPKSKLSKGQQTESINLQSTSLFLRAQSEANKEARKATV